MCLQFEKCLYLCSRKSNEETKTLSATVATTATRFTNFYIKPDRPLKGFLILNKNLYQSLAVVAE